jgi:hypothetical protein
MGEPWFMRRLAPPLNYLREAGRRNFFSVTTLTCAGAPDKVEAVSSGAVAEWFVSLYPRRRSPVVDIGLSNGALTMPYCGAKNRSPVMTCDE